MKPENKIKLLKQLCCKSVLSESIFYEILEKCDALKSDYYEYMTTAPINCDEELQRLPAADYDLCCALITLLLREDHFSNGSFEHRQRLGQVEPIIKRMIDFLTPKEPPHR